MRNKFYLFLLALLCSNAAFAGGLFTNSNQSAGWTRMLSRNASTDIDAVYYNPAGLVNLSDGLNLSFSNQTVLQNYEVSSTYPTLNDGTYKAEVTAPVYPNLYAAYKANRFVFSFGFTIAGGGGSAEYANGLPSFETPVSMLPSLISSFGIPTQNYAMDQYFNGSSIYYGMQVGVSYKINDWISAAAGVRYVYANNHYEGYLKNVMVNPVYPDMGLNGDMMSASTFFNAIGQPAYAAMVSDKTVDASQTASGFTPIVSINLTPMEKLNLSLRYEGNTSLEFTNETKVDDTGLFVDGEKSQLDMPASFNAGIQYQVGDKLSAQVSYDLYFDKNANYGGREELIDNNYYAIGLGLDYAVNDMFTVSGGYLLSQTGVGENYNTDMSYSLSSNSVALGGKFNVNEKLSLEAGLVKMFFEEGEQSFDADAETMSPEYKVSYEKSGFLFGVGVNFHL